MFRQLIWSALTVLPFGLMGQSIAPRLLGPYGIFSTSQGVSITSTLGELSIGTEPKSGVVLTQGVQQPADPGIPLPIKLLSFTANLIANNSQTRLDWSTAEEQNNDHFDILRSQDGRNFAFWQTVQAKGDSRIKQDYSAVDVSPFNGHTFYQLKQVDLDGTSAYSSIVSVERTSVKALMPYPQPARGTLFIPFTSTIRQDLQWDIFDMTGRLLQSRRLTAVEGLNTLEWDVQAFAAGFYLIKCRNNEAAAFKILLQ